MAEAYKSVLVIDDILNQVIHSSLCTLYLIVLAVLENSS